MRKDVTVTFDVTKEMLEKDLLTSRDGWNVYSNLASHIEQTDGPIADTDTLGFAFEPELRFEDPDGKDIVISDLLFCSR